MDKVVLQIKEVMVWRVKVRKSFSKWESSGNGRK